jgi:hypothetical protein
VNEMELTDFLTEVIHNLRQPPGRSDCAGWTVLLCSRVSCERDNLFDSFRLRG